ncbi:hypothetical protein BDY17DRAFT_301957 [Neohortaea acidophila]|uniref:non-specific serine/threonine protein kinase n=1 Tax=Neohortaea acidophila TaxID=245834 RepID=A0A6A6PL57_9PEZI|nr:uncharacterized protein BDY17DRAFT_301957 [Neohortaea acidophila]KAF2480536.1 hypothetical protein BDY17DRAFT_301957 [Neohortaea acidophila]
MPPSHSAVGIKNLFLLCSLLVPIAVGALQQQPHDHHALRPRVPSDDLSEHAAAAAAATHGWAHPAGDSLNADGMSADRAFRNTHPEHTPQSPPHPRRIRSHTNERALATLSPAESNPAVRAPPAPSRSSTTAGLSSRPPARSLQDWRVEDIILLATVDGRISARSRDSGAEMWQLATTPMVETIYHPHNKSVDESGVELEDPLWIVEPSQDGSIYLFAPTSGFGIQKLGFTVRQLVDRSPLASEGHPAVVYTAAKRSDLYTVDAATGDILKIFTSTGSTVSDDQRCRKVNPLASLEEEECESIGTLTLGRTVYTVRVQDRNTGEQISTITYSEWVPNNNDEDLRNQYNTAMDEKYVYTGHDGTVWGRQLASYDGKRLPSPEGARYRQKLTSPVARVFDIVRRHDDWSNDASLVILPQPILRPPQWSQDSLDESQDLIFVDYIDDGSWYALSESNYPTVTSGVDQAVWSSDYPFGTVPETWPHLSNIQRQQFAGVHYLLQQYHASPGGHLIDPPNHPSLDPPPMDPGKHLIGAPPSVWDRLPSLRNILLLVILGLVACGVLYRQQSLAREKKIPIAVAAELIEAKEIVPAQEQPKEESVPMVRELEPATETIFPHQADRGSQADGGAEESVEPGLGDEDFEKIEAQEAEEAPEAEQPKNAEEPEPKPEKKARRGKRGGKKQREKDQVQAEARAKRSDSQPPTPPAALPPPPPATEIISVAASESPQVSGPLQINSLLIHTDKVIGQGSCGTSVFEGAFEGRDVAVKRMLSQYYELASQEVSFLQQSDDHPNVIRYFCQQKDDHFLYIAVELCQASLFEVWEGEKARTEARQTQLRTLKHAIQQDIPRVLQQLAAGLYHLHNLRIIHRDIKPQNILVAFPKRNQNQGPRLVISDFGLGKNLPENVSTLIDPTGNAGTSGWKAPELISQPRDTESRHSQNNSHTGGSEGPNGVMSGVKRAADIFSLGCLFFWVLTDGIHPYEDENGWQQLRELNIKRDNKKMDVLERWSDAYEPMQLITSMLEHQPEHRPTALQVLNHPFFWPAEKRLLFLCDMSDHFEREERGIPDDGYAGDSWDLHALECRAAEVIGPGADFLAKLDRHFVDTLGKQRKYSGGRLLDLLRALRNKKHHYEDMPEDVKRRVGPLAGGYLAFWCNRFPRLLMACYEVVHEAGLQGNDRFKGYFAVGRT